MIVYTFVGWNNTAGHDKVWVCIKLRGNYRDASDYVTAWGGRGHKLQTKLYKDQDVWSMSRICNKKEESGYTDIDVNQLDTVYPNFKQDLEKTAMWAVLKL